MRDEPVPVEMMDGESATFQKIARAGTRRMPNDLVRQPSVTPSLEGLATAVSFAKFISQLGVENGNTTERSERRNAACSKDRPPSTRDSAQTSPSFSCEPAAGIRLQRPMPRVVKADALGDSRGLPPPRAVGSAALALSRMRAQVAPTGTPGTRSGPTRV